MLKVKNIRSGYGEVNVLQELTFDVEHEVYTILGANGAGKTTLMKTIARVLPLNGGELYFEEKDISGLTPYEVAARGIAFVPQEENVFPTMTVLENLSIGSVLLNKKLKKEKMDEVFDLFPALYERRGQKAGSLSGGEAQMAAVGRALMQDPRLILLDEPTAGLSPLYVDLFFQKVKEIHEKKKVSIIISEQNATKALEIANKVMVMHLGTIHFIQPCVQCTLDMIKEGYRIGC